MMLRRGRSVVDRIFPIRQILENFRKQIIELQHIFVDLQAAYDTVWRKEYWSEMHKLGFPSESC
jgi:hypothetical protein